MNNSQVKKKLTLNDLNCSKTKYDALQFSLETERNIYL